MRYKKFQKNVEFKKHIYYLLLKIYYHKNPTRVLLGNKNLQKKYIKLSFEFKLSVVYTNN